MTTGPGLRLGAFVVLVAYALTPLRSPCYILSMASTTRLIPTSTPRTVEVWDAGTYAGTVAPHLGEARWEATYGATTVALTSTRVAAAAALLQALRGR